MALWFVAYPKKNCEALTKNITSKYSPNDAPISIVHNNLFFQRLRVQLIIAPVVVFRYFYF
jgi:hypothetical protein